MPTTPWFPLQARGSSLYIVTTRAGLSAKSHQKFMVKDIELIVGTGISLSRPGNLTLRRWRTGSGQWSRLGGILSIDTWICNSSASSSTRHTSSPGLLAQALSGIAQKYPEADKVLLTGTPFEVGPHTFKAAVGSFCCQWKEHKSTIESDQWRQRAEYRKGLGQAADEQLVRLGKEYEAIVRTYPNIDGAREHKLLEELTKAMQILTVRRTETSKFFGQQVIALPRNHHVTVEVRMPERLLAMCNDSLKEVRARFVTEFEQRLARWRQNRKGDEPRPNLGRLMNLLHRDRILNTFPALAKHNETKQLKLTDAELSENNWLVFRSRNDLEPQLTRSPFGRLVASICAPDNCPKIDVLAKLLDKLERADPMAKLVVVTSSPVSTLILYLVSPIYP